MFSSSLKSCNLTGLTIEVDEIPLSLYSQHQARWRCSRGWVAALVDVPCALVAAAVAGRPGQPSLRRGLPRAPARDRCCLVGRSWCPRRASEVVGCHGIQQNIAAVMFPTSIRDQYFKMECVWKILEYHQPTKKNMNHSLVGGFNHLENYYSMGRIIPYIMENTSHV